jgi:hypothetical protein
MARIVKACSCSHAMQDKLYGKGMRLHTEDKKGSEQRCTVCKPRRRESRLISYANGYLPAAGFAPSKMKTHVDYGGRIIVTVMP